MCVCVDCCDTALYSNICKVPNERERRQHSQSIDSLIYPTPGYAIESVFHDCLLVSTMMFRTVMRACCAANNSEDIATIEK